MGRVERIKREAKKIGAQVFIVEEKLNNPGIVAFRKAKCKGCKFYTGPERDECEECTCVISVKAETYTYFHYPTWSIRKNVCPWGKWNDKEEANRQRKEDGKSLIE